MKSMSLKKIKLSCGILSSVFLILLSSGCSNAGFAPAKKELEGTEVSGVSDPTSKSGPVNPGGVTDPTIITGPVNPGNPTDPVQLALTFDTPSEGARINYSNFGTVRASGTCNLKDGTVTLSVDNREVGSASCDGSKWVVEALSNLSFTTPGNFVLKAEILNSANEKASVTRNLTRAELDRTMDVTITANTKITRNKLKVFLIIDNSGSMDNEQSRLASGMANLANSMKQYDVEFFVYTTTAGPVNGKSIKSTTMPTLEYSWEDPQTGSQLTGASLPSNIASGNYSYSYYSSLQNAYGRVAFASAMSDLEFQQQKDKLSAAVNVGITGSQHEAGLLSMAHILSASDFNSRFSIAPSSLNQIGDKVVFLIVTDNDDQTASESAQTKSTVLSYKSEVDETTAWTKVTNISEASMQKASYSIGLIKLHSKVASSCNGDPCFKESDKFIAVDPAKYGSSSIACTDAMKAEVAAHLTADVVSCDYALTARTVQYNSVNPANICTAAFVYSGVTYQSAYDFQLRTADSAYKDSLGKNYIPKAGSCAVAYYKSVASAKRTNTLISSTSVEKALSDGKSTVLAEALKIKLESQFGKQGYFVSAIINRTDMGTATCRSQAEGVGTKYLSFLQSLGTQGYSNTICLEDYSPALAPIKDFAEHIINKSVQISLDSLESVFQATIYRGSQVIPLANSDFSVALGSDGKLYVNVVASSVQENDIVRLGVRSL